MVPSESGRYNLEEFPVEQMKMDYCCEMLRSARAPGFRAVHGT